VPGGVEPSNLDKVYWPQAGLTKGDLIDYYDRVAPFVLPALRGRPLTVKRYPDGIEGFSFFQKNTPKYAPEWVQTISLRAESAGRDVAYTLCNSKRTLLWLANQGTIELHPWLSRADRLDRPDHLVMDLDPPEGAFEMAVEVAFVVKSVLEELGLKAAAKTSGAKGVHVYVPIGRRYDYPEVRAAAVAVARRVEEAEPDRTTTEFRIAARGKRVYLDAGRNAPGAHIIAPYSPRARPAASVSFPVSWDELGGAHPEDFTIRNVPDLLRGKDRWRQLMPRPQTLPAELRRPGGAA
jgi:bifunctional non-homologous end joining protein LigD